MIMNYIILISIVIYKNRQLVNNFSVYNKLPQNNPRLKDKPHFITKIKYFSH